MTVQGDFDKGLTVVSALSACSNLPGVTIINVVTVKKKVRRLLQGAGPGGGGEGGGAPVVVV